MTSNAWILACGAAMFVSCWPLMFAASTGLPSRRHAVYIVLAAFLLGLLGLLLVAVGLRDDNTIHY